MSAVGLSRAEAIALVQRIMEADYYACEDEVNDWLDRLDRALSCPSGHVSDLVFWPPVRELSAEDVVDHALGYRPIVL
ncbi:e9imm peptide [Streptomyces sp. NBC_00887]|uniref:e9imm peptide n=1 Tax=Streptomyces sp. NBC_00887 TaxID=2975859 RepID=UPI00386ECB43|nr:e9imm peptide [Streptomyces sp. NBC_00887]WSY36059.1 e9imm peptide [Streptomyces sp. NBC_00887]